MLIKSFPKHIDLVSSCSHTFKTFFSITLNKIKTSNFQSLYKPNVFYPTLIHQSKFTFSSHVSASSKLPNIHKLKLQVEQAKDKKGEKSIEYVELLHKLSLELCFMDFWDEALPIAEKVIKLSEDIYTKNPQKNMLEQAQTIIYLRTLQGIYKSLKQFPKYFQITDKIIKLGQQILKKQPKVTSLVSDLYHDLGTTYFELNQFDKSVEMLQKALGYTPNNNQLPFLKEKNLKARNIIGYVLLHKQHQIDQSFKVYSQNLAQIKKGFDEKFEMDIICHCLINLTKIYISKLPNLPDDQLISFLKNIKQLSKDVMLHYINNDLDIKELLNFNRNLALLHVRAKDYTKALQCYRFERQYIPKNDLNALAQSYQNQAKIYQMTKKVEKSIEKLQKSFEIRQQLNQLLGQKKRKSIQEEMRQKQNKDLMGEISLKMSQLYQQINNSKNYQIWKQKHESLLKS